MTERIRTRIAPSPTGDPHVGTAYVALFNLAFARSQGGDFVLRIEDTDRSRSTAASEAAILRSLRWLGLGWDEGPEVGGAYGPYRQSERGELYTDAVHTLIETGHAFHCFCSAQRLRELRRAQLAAQETPRYDGHCLGLGAPEIERRRCAGEASVVRMRVPDEGVCVIEDLFRGEIRIDWQQVDMQVLLKSDGLPTYHLANVVDDHHMAISHVIRGEDWISSAPKHLLLYRYFGWAPPVFAHLPLLRNPDTSRLSKRKNPTSIEYYRRMGYLPEAVVNFLGLMSYSMADGREQFSLQEFLAEFALERIHLGGPVFDQKKLSWLNGLWLRSLDDAAFAERVRTWMLNEARLMPLIPLVKERTERLSDLIGMTDYLLGEPAPAAHQLWAKTGLETEQLVELLQFVCWRLEELKDWSRAALVTTLTQLAQELDMKIRVLLAPLFIALAGRQVALPIYDSMVLLGPELTRARLNAALTALGGVSKRRLQQLLQRYQELDREGRADQPSEGPPAPVS